MTCRMASQHSASAACCTTFICRPTNNGAVVISTFAVSCPAVARSARNTAREFVLVDDALAADDAEAAVVVSNDIVVCGYSPPALLGEAELVLGVTAAAAVGPCIAVGGERAATGWGDIKNRLCATA